MFNFEKLDVWPRAADFADLIYTDTRRFPPDERFGLTNQMRRAAVSVSSKIAEGTSRSSKTDFGRFIEISTGSLFEVVSQAFIAKRQGFLKDEQFQILDTAAEEKGRNAKGLKKSLLPSEKRMNSKRLSTLNSQP